MTARVRRTQVPYGRASAPYRSISCRIGSHPACEHASPAAAPADIPVIFETCTCSCHRATSSTGGDR